MTGSAHNGVWLECWQLDDLRVLERSNTPEITRFVGGPESAQQVIARHAKFLRLWETNEARMFRIRFTLTGKADYDYPLGHPIRVNEWMFDLAALRTPN
ncbi:hypothetical protein [Salinibacterium sp. TMP30]|uniref:hypothetical protein n=1 Tax=Salinibacterium sp. TMP30 TaxID=3138237 RepID=UPI003139ED04